jgi:tRNA 2-thiouridine synthesizing protein A
MAPVTHEPHKTCDFRDLRCPNLLIATIKVIEKLPPGQIVRVIARDLNAPSSLTSWTRQSGHTLLDMYQENADFVFLIQCEPKALPVNPSG